MRTARADIGLRGKPARIEDRIERLANSDRKRDMRDAIRLLLAELSSLQILGQKQAAALKGKGGKC